MSDFATAALLIRIHRRRKVLNIGGQGPEYWGEQVGGGGANNILFIIVYIHAYI